MRKPTEELSWEEFNLTQDEIDALESQNLKVESITAIEKIVRDNIMSAFCLLDGVSDPVLEKGNDIWFEVDRKARKRRGRRVFT